MRTGHTARPDRSRGQTDLRRPEWATGHGPLARPVAIRIDYPTLVQNAEARRLAGVLERMGLPIDLGTSPRSEGATTTPRSPVHPDPRTPGTTWTETRGEVVWTLSGHLRTLTRQRDSVSLHALRPDADRLVDQFLAVRPTGGRVWTDEKGHAVTMIGGTLTYLGNIHATP